MRNSRPAPSLLLRLATTKLTSRCLAAIVPRCAADIGGDGNVGYANIAGGGVVGDGIRMPVSAHGGVFVKMNWVVGPVLDG